MTIKLEGMLDHNNDDLEWLYWNPLLFSETANKIMRKKGFIPNDHKYSDEPPSLGFEFTFPAEGTVGAMMKKCEQQCREVIRETELYLMKKVEKKLKK